MNPIVPSRRDFLKGAAAAAAAGVVPMSVVKLAFADPAQDFTFAYISDAHIQHISGTKFVRNWDRGPHPGGGGDEPPHPEAGLRDVRGRPRPARHEGGARSRGGDALEAQLQDSTA